MSQQQVICWPAAPDWHRLLAGLRGYLIAFGAVAVALAVRLAMDRFCGSAAPFLTFYLAVLVLVRLEEVGPAIFTILLSFLLADWFFIAPRYSLSIASVGDGLNSACFLLLGFTLLALSWQSRAAFRREHQALLALQRQAADLKATEEFSRRLISSSADSINVLDLSGRLLAMNAAGQRLLEIANLEPYLNRSWLSLWSEADRPLVRQAVERAQAGATGHFCACCPSLKGTPRWWDVVVTPVCNPQGQPERLLAISRDITQRRRAEVALRHATEALAHSNEQLEAKVRERTAQLQEVVGELEGFSYSISHDLRAPLRALHGFSAILEMEFGPRLTRKGRDYLSRINKAADQMDQLITDVLNYSRMSHQDLRIQPVDVGLLLRRMVDSYPHLQPPKATIAIAPDLPLLQGNEAALTQCFSNLLGNAVKFVKPGQAAHIQVYSEPRNGLARIWVADDGIGIAKEMQEQVFGLFQRVSKDYEGTGLGLAIVRKATERMGGCVGVESEPGQGSRFWVELPLAASASTPAQPEVALAPPRSPSYAERERACLVG